MILVEPLDEVAAPEDGADARVVNADRGLVLDDVVSVEAKVDGNGEEVFADVKVVRVEKSEIF